MIKKCPHCHVEMVEIRKVLLKDGSLKQVYPQIVPKEPNQTRYFNEFRFYCNSCNREWLINTIPGKKRFNEVPQDSQYIYSKKDNALVPRGP